MAFATNCWHLCQRSRPAAQTCMAVPSFSAANYIPRKERLRAAMDWHTLRNEEDEQCDYVASSNANGRLLLAIADFGEQPGAEACATALARRDDALYEQQPTTSLARRLGVALRESPASAAALAATVQNGILRVAWAGAIGYVVIRDDKVVARSYDTVSPARALEEVLNAPSKAPQLRSDFLVLEDGDVCVFGTDGLFANVDERQLLAFVRPVPDPTDSVLGIANHTCLGSWTSPDPTFISTYLAYLAHNFANATRSAPHLAFPFPPSPHADDVTCLVVTVEFDV